MIRWGANRVVFLVGRWAIKLPHVFKGWRGFYYGSLNNLNEAKFSHRPGACPVLWTAWGGVVSVMPRCTEVAEEYFATLNVPAWAKDRGLVVEAKRDSFGLLDGILVAVDYGYPQEIAW